MLEVWTPFHMEVGANFPHKTKVIGRHDCKGKLKFEERDMTASLFHNSQIDFRLNENTLTRSP